MGRVCHTYVGDGDIKKRKSHTLILFATQPTLSLNGSVLESAGVVSVLNRILG